MNFDERYVHAIERALEGRDLRSLLKLLDRGTDGDGVPFSWLLHPCLGPALADVIRSQTDGARGTPAKLTTVQKRIIKNEVARWALHDPVRRGAKGRAVAEFADLFGVSTDTIERAIKELSPAK